MAPNREQENAAGQDRLLRLGDGTELRAQIKRGAVVLTVVAWLAAVASAHFVGWVAPLIACGAAVCVAVLWLAAFVAYLAAQWVRGGSRAVAATLNAEDDEAVSP